VILLSPEPRSGEERGRRADVECHALAVDGEHV